MSNIVPEKNMLLALDKAERHLLSRYGLRLQVDKVSANGRYALCTAKQVGRKMFRSAMPTEESVAVCHTALIALHIIGLEPLIDIKPHTSSAVMPALDGLDPFGLRVALSATGLEAMLVPGFAVPRRNSQDSMIRPHPTPNEQ